MGYIYKNKPIIVKFILRQKSLNPDLSCRKLASLAGSKFGIKLSKSSVNCIIRDHKLSSPVGRRSKRLINLQGEDDHGSFSILNAIDKQLDISKIATQVLLNLQPSLASDFSEQIEAIMQALILFKSIYGLTIETTRCYDNNEIWTLIGSRPSKSIYNKVMGLLENTQLLVNELVTEFRRNLMPVSGFRFQSRDNSSFFIDAELMSVWSSPLKNRGLFTTFYKAKSYINSFIKGKEIVSIFNIQGDNLYSSEALDFISALNGQNVSKRIKLIEILDLDGNILETIKVDDSHKRFFLLGFWPWQIENIAEFESKPAKNKLVWSEFGVEFFYQIEEISLSQYIIAQEVKYLAILLKNNTIGAARIGILSNMPPEMIHNNLEINKLYHWISPENKHNEFNKIVKEPLYEKPVLFPDSTDAFISENKENYLDNIFTTLSQLIFYQFKNKFIPRECSSWNPLKIKDVFLRQKAIINRKKEIISYKILISNELCKENDIQYICQQLNHFGLRSNHDKLTYFSLAQSTPK
ncbi:MAG: hypothetical protein ABIA97_04160 [Candidatus Omnitrophota bacterium]